MEILGIIATTQISELLNIYDDYKYAYSDRAWVYMRYCCYGRAFCRILLIWVNCNILVLSLHFFQFSAFQSSKLYVNFISDFRGF